MSTQFRVNVQTKHIECKWMQNMVICRSSAPHKPLLAPLTDPNRCHWVHSLDTISQWTALLLATIATPAQCQSGITWLNSIIAHGSVHAEQSRWIECCGGERLVNGCHLCAALDRQNAIFCIQWLLSESGFNRLFAVDFIDLSQIKDNPIK